MRPIDEAVKMLADKLCEYHWFISIGIMGDQIVLMVTDGSATEVQNVKDGFEGYEVIVDVLAGGVVARPAYPGE